jgi:RND family efflux transporter MFP subunit
MRSDRKRLVFIAAIAAGVMALVVGFLALNRPPEAAVQTLEARTIELALSVVGRARPQDLVQVASPNPGQIIRLLHDDGDVVAAGAPLAVVRATVEQAQIDADLARARAARAEAAEARLSFSRTQTLHQRGFAAQAALDAARATLQTAEANVAAADAQVRAASERAREFTILAPMSGVVLFRPIDNGQVVAAGETLFELGSTAGVEIQAEVEEAYADVLRPNLLARAALSGSSDVFTARVTEVSPQVDSATGGRLVKLVPDGAQALPPGRSIDVTIVVEERQGALTVPRSAVVDATAAPKVFVLNADDVIEARPVSVARWPSVNAIITDGLRAGDRIVLEPSSLSVGQRVRPVAPAQSGD